MHDTPAYPGAPASAVLVDPELVRKCNISGPRYASYPTADHFVEAYDSRAHQITLCQRNTLQPPGRIAQPLSLYVHIPFCNTLCFFCKCHMVVSRDHRRVARYLRYLAREFSLVAGMLGGARQPARVHLGGGTPSILNSLELEQLMRELGRHFDLAPGEHAIEIDPRTADEERIATLAKLGFTSMSFGVQDFDPDVQQAVNRIQTVAETAQVISLARRHGVSSVNLDLIHGLPRQTLAGFDQTLDHVLGMRPDRIALYSYAHLPAIFKPQRHIDARALPDMEAKLQVMTLAINRLTTAGYVYLGMDHFALPHDKLAIAARRAGLRHNFEGYSAHPEGDLIAFGVSAISKIGATYSQNVKTLDAYYDRLDHDELPVLRGINLTADDLLRRTVIQSLLCHFELSIESIEIAYLMKFRDYFSAEWDNLEALERDGIITIDPEWITVTPRGRLLVRTVAMVFDKHLSRSEQRARFAKVI
ncbi:MAG: oxygen-independent coproporphyrinogen III oxidase [Betaproteobacteria bacterium]